MLKQTRFEVLRNTWPNPNAIPQALIDSDNITTYEFNLIGVLLAIGVFTRPLETQGFHLSDLWAWLRYLPAFSSQYWVRMRQEWKSLDFHHKTVASGDFGVGFSTWILMDLLGFLDYIDVLHVVQVLDPARFVLGSSATRGPGKSPDYVAYGPGSDISVLECKGTQSSPTYLRGALTKGISQKSNLQMAGGVAFTHSLVAGEYVPQWDSTSDATFMVCDPPKKAIRSQLSEYTPDQVNRASSRASLARDLSHFGLTESVQGLLGENKQFPTMQAAVDADFRRREYRPGGLAIEFNYDLPQRILHGDIVGDRVVFKAELRKEIVDRLRVDAAPDEFSGQLWESRSQAPRRINTDVMSASYTSPNGVEFTLAIAVD